MDILQGLSEVQKSNHVAALTRLGLPADHKNYDTFETKPGVNVLSSDPATSAIKPTLIPVANIAELNKLAGIPDHEFASGQRSDAAVNYPPPPTPERLTHLASCKNTCDLDFHMTSEENDQAQRAAEAYMMGDSSKLAAWEPLLNAKFFPTQVSAFAGGSIVVKAGSQLVINAQNPIVIASSITVEYTGQIVVQTSGAQVTTQTFTQEPQS